MGGRMTYQRFRARNELMARPVDPSRPYDLDPELHARWRDAPMPRNDCILNGDLNRMEWGYTDPDSMYADAAVQVAEETGVDIDTVRKVLRYVFLEQR